MFISVRNFCSLKITEFDINPGISIIAGKNGSGKSQLLMSIAHQFGRRTLLDYVYNDINDKGVFIDPIPTRILYRPAVRQYGYPSTNIFTSIKPPDYINKYDTYQGYTTSLEQRFNSLHNDLSRLYVSAYVPNSKGEVNENSWRTIESSFNRVFDRRICGEFDPLHGARIGLSLEDHRVTSFYALSTGELEFLSLIKDMVTEVDVDVFLIDEIDAHFHPDLQIKLIDEISSLVGERYCLITSHSPSLMLSVDPNNVFFLQKYEDVKEGENQIVRLFDNFDVLQAVSKLYLGFVSDIRFSAFLSNSANHEMFNFIDGCLKPASVVDASKTNQHDPQNSILRGLMLSMPSQTQILDYGCGKGRLISAFAALDSASLGRISYTGFDINTENQECLRDAADKLGLNSRFAESVKLTQTLENVHFDICIMANVLHEIGPDKIVDNFNSLFYCSNRGARILILESLLLDIGESNYVVFDGEAILKMFLQLTEDNSVSVRMSNPSSFSGKPLLETLITIEKDDCTLTNKDVRLGLETVVNKCAQKISEHLSGIKLEPREYAFYCHNLAHAQAYIHRLS